MPRLPLTFACCRYDRMEAIREGAVTVEGVDLTCLTLKSGRDVFDRMVGGQEFDVAELSASEFVSLAGHRQQSVRGAAGVSFARVPARLHFRQCARRHPLAEGSRRQTRRRAALHADRGAVGARTPVATVRRRSRYDPVGAGRGRGCRHPRQAACAAAASAGEDRAERQAGLARRTAGARRDRCPDRLTQAGDVRPRSRRGAAVSELSRARTRALPDRQNFSDHASHCDPAVALRAPPLARHQLLQGVRGGQARGRGRACATADRSAPCCRG